MSKFLINGGKKLSGYVNISGSKNSVLPILAACVVTGSVVRLKNCPDLSDVKVSIEILKSLGCKVTIENDCIEIDSTNINDNEISELYSKKMRSSIIFLSSILSRKKSACIYSPGGCDLGERPIDLHIYALQKMGVDIYFKSDKIIANVNKFIDYVEVNFKKKSVGATENAIIYSCISNGRVLLKNVAKEPEIVDLVNFLNKCGADIRGAGTDNIEISGVKELNGCEYKIMPDRIETMTYMGFVACCGGEVKLNNIDISTIRDGIEYFKKAGCDIVTSKDSLKISRNGTLNSIEYLETAPYPSFSTDAQPIFVAVMATAKGKTKFVETVFENRYKYINEMLNFNVNIKVDGQCAYVEGTDNLIPSKARATDLRGGVALVMIASTIKGESIIEEIYHINRGYGDFLNKLTGIGIDIRKES